jgi:hypothetical protein
MTVLRQGRRISANWSNLASCYPLLLLRLPPPLSRIYTTRRQGDSDRQRERESGEVFRTTHFLKLYPTRLVNCMAACTNGFVLKGCTGPLKNFLLVAVAKICQSKMKSSSHVNKLLKLRVVRWLAARQAGVRISARHPTSAKVMSE